MNVSASVAWNPEVMAMVSRRYARRSSDTITADNGPPTVVAEIALLACRGSPW
jgi:hypothetical protein